MTYGEFKKQMEVLGVKDENLLDSKEVKSHKIGKYNLIEVNLLINMERKSGLENPCCEIDFH